MDNLTEKYPHIPFKRNWDVSPDIRVLLARIAERIRLLGQLPILPDARKHLYRVSLTKGAQATVAIEGNNMSLEDVERIHDNEPTKDVPAQYLEQEVRNMLDALNHCLQTACDGGEMGLMDDALLKDMHRRVGRDLGELFEAIPGKYRDHRVSVGKVYSAPDNSDVDDLMTLFFDFMKRNFYYESRKQDIEMAIMQAIVAHVYIELIHPFGDGNGRTGRLLEFWLLLRGGVSAPAAHLMSNYYNETRASYYKELKDISKTRDLTSFIRYALIGLYKGLEGLEKEIIGQSWRTVWQRHVYNVFYENDVLKKAKGKRVLALAVSLPPGISFEPVEVIAKLPEISQIYLGSSYLTLVRDMQYLVDMNLLIEVDEKPKKYRLATDEMVIYRQPKRP